MWMYWTIHMFFYSFYPSSGLIIHIFVASFGLISAFLVEPQTTMDNVWAAASILVGLWTWMTPVINQALLLSHLALLFPKDNFILDTGLSLAREFGSWDIQSSGYNTRCTSSEQEGQCGTADGGGHGVWPRCIFCVPDDLASLKPLL